MKKVILIFGILISYGSLVKAESAPQASSFEFSGYLDFYFQKNVNNQATTSGRAFGTRNNVMQLNFAELTAKRKQGNVTFRVDLAAGEATDTLAGANAEPTRQVSQATVSYTPSKLENLTFTVGKMYTHVGLEVVRAKDNWQYTRGYLFNYGIPLWHQGFSLNYVFVPKVFAATLFAYNSWDGRLANETNKSMTMGANLNFTGVENLTLNYNYIGGPETADSRSIREVHELNGIFSFAERFAVAFDAIMGSQKRAITATESDAKWNSWAIYAKATLGFYTFSPRYEVFDDSDKGYALSAFSAAGGTQQKISSFTLSNNFDLGDGLETRLEYRRDTSDKSGFFKDIDGAAGDKETTINVAFLYNF